MNKLFENFPVLYKKSTQGKIELWGVEIEDMGDGTARVLSTYGEVGGKMQTTFDTIREGKNIGKKNETTVIEQAYSEAKSKWEKKKKKGYVENPKDAEAGKVDALIEGGIEPMLAQTFEKHSDKIVYPAYVQPKLDGIRCIAIKKGNNVTLWSRTRKRITSCPHIEKAICEQFENYDVILDGELYNHDLKNDFEKIVSVVRKENFSKESEQVQYHIYDMPSFRGISDLKFHERRVYMSCIHMQLPLVEVETNIVCSADEMLKDFKIYRKNGYEGLMLRNRLSLYENKRSYHLQKVKEFQDAEFEIVGVVEGKGKLQGLLGAFLCKTQDGTEFEVKMTGNQEETKKFLNDSSLWKGKMLTVQYQGLTGKNKVPRFPVGLRLREEGL